MYYLMEVQSAPLIHRRMSQEQNLIDIEDTIEVETSHDVNDDYHLTELKSMGSEAKDESREEDLLHGELLDKGTVPDRTRELQAEDSHFRFLKNLATVVKRNRCFYDNEETSMRKLSNIDFSTRMWQAVADDVKYSGSLDSLQGEWIDLKESFANFIARNGSIHEANGGEVKPIFKELEWLTPYVTPQGKSQQVAVMGSHIPLSRVQQDNHPNEYYGEHLSVGQDVMISGYQQPSHQIPSSSHRVQSHSSPSTSQIQQPKGSGIFILRNSGAGPSQLRIVNSSSSGAESGHRVTVVPRSHGNVLHLQPAGQIARNSHRVQIIHSNSGSQPSSSHYERLESGSGVSSSGNAMAGPMKKDVSLMLEASPYYNGKKVFHLVSMHDVENNSSNGPPRKRIAFVTNSRNSNQPSSSHHHMQSSSAQMPPLVPLGNPGTSSLRHSQSISQLGDDVVIDDGIIDDDAAVVIDEDGPESPLLSDSPTMGSMMISGHQVQRHGHLNQRSMQHHSQHDAMLSTSPSPHPGYSQQSQYDADLQFQQLISGCLSRMDEDSKAMTKFHIQKILTESRYGPGTCLRELQEEALSEANGVPEHEPLQ